MGATTIRPAMVDDLPVVDDLANDAVGAPQPQGKYLDDPTHGRVILVAEDNAQIVGMISAGPPPKGVFGVDEEGRPVDDLHKAPWWKVYALATTNQRAGIGTALLREIHQRLPRRMRGLYGNVSDNRQGAISFYRSVGFYLAPSIGIEGHADRQTLMIEYPGELYFLAPRQRLFRPPTQWENRHADRLMEREIKSFKRLRKRSDVGYRTWLRSLPSVPAACGHDQLGPRPLVTYGHDPAHRLWCTSCQEKALDVIARHPDMDESEDICDRCGKGDPGTEHGWAHDEQRRIIGMAHLCTACRRAAGREPGHG